MKDQLNRSLHFNTTPKRIVSLVPSQTELLVDLGLKPFIVGVTKFCVHPKRLRREKTVVGGTKQVHYDKIKALKPDVILCNKEENTENMVRALEQIAPVHLSDIYTIADSLELTAMYGKLFDIENKAQQLINAIELKLHQFKTEISSKSKQRVAYFIWKNPYMVAANNTFIDDMLRLNNFENVFAHVSRYPEIHLSELETTQPDLVFLSSEPYPFKPSDFEVFEAVCPNAKVIRVDGESFSWYGSRLLKAFDYFKALKSVI